MQSLHIITLLVSLFTHPFHASVAEINFDNEDERIEVTLQIFHDDFEDAINKYAKENFILLNDIENEDLRASISSYLNEHLYLKQDGSKISLALLDIEFDEDQELICYLRSEKMKMPKQFIIHNSILIDDVHHQENIVNISFGSFAMSYKMNEKKVEVLVEVE